MIMNLKDETLNLTNLKYFCDAIRLGGLSAAAKINFVSQSAISQAIQKLEKSLELDLLAHHPNRLRLTPQGEEVFEQGLDLLKRAHEFKQNLNSENRSVGNLDFACTYSFSLTIIPHYLKKFREEYPDVKINFFIEKNENIKQMVKEGTIDFGILPNEGDLTKFNEINIFKGHLRFYASKNLHSSDRKRLGFILPHSNSKELILINEAYFLKFNKKLSASLEVSSWEVIANLTALGMGIGYFPDYIAQRIGNLQEIDFGLTLHEYQFSAISSTGMKRRQISELFLSYF
jgi:DNA-binding transcriptional LysR family regulator